MVLAVGAEAVVEAVVEAEVVEVVEVAVMVLEIAYWYQAYLYSPEQPGVVSIVESFDEECTSG